MAVHQVSAITDPELVAAFNVDDIGPEPPVEDTSAYVAYVYITSTTTDKYTAPLVLHI